LLARGIAGQFPGVSPHAHLLASRSQISPTGFSARLTSISDVTEMLKAIQQGDPEAIT
jgi:hypothetical protein